MLLFIFTGVSLVGQITLTPGTGPIEQPIELAFNDEAINRKDTVVFRLKYDTANFYVNTKPEFSIIDNLLIIPADLYDKTVSDTNGVVVVFSPKQGVDAFSDNNILIEVLPLASSNNIGDNIDYGGEKFAEISGIEYYIPTPRWIIVLSVIIGVIIILIVTWLILKMDNMPLGKKTFQRGKINFLNVDAPVTSIKLDSLDGLAFDKYYPELSDTALVPIDKRKRKKKKRMARFVCKDAALKISIENGTFKESFLGSGELYHMDRVEITLPNQKTITLEYTNSKNPRSYGI